MSASRRRALQLTALVALTGLAAGVATAAASQDDTTPSVVEDGRELLAMNTLWGSSVRPLPASTRQGFVIAAATDAVAASEPARTVWDDIADCESGKWINGKPITGTARWDYGLDFDHGDFFEGGVNFHPQTWDAYRDPDMPGHAGLASKDDQIVVAERVLADQGWGAWPVCSRKLGLR